MTSSVKSSEVKSNRSTCKICGKGIEKKALRVGKIMEVENRRRQKIISPVWAHSTCFFSLKEGFKSKNGVKGLHNLSDEDREYVSSKLFHPDIIPCIQTFFNQSCPFTFSSHLVHYLEHFQVGSEESRSKLRISDALVITDNVAIAPEDWENFKAEGLVENDLVVISGSSEVHMNKTKLTPFLKIRSMKLLGSIKEALGNP